MASFTEHISKQLADPSGRLGVLVHWVLNRQNARQYRAVMEHIHLGAGDTILDIGFGNGWLIRKLLRKGPRKVCGIEISSDMVERVGRRLKRFTAADRLELTLGEVKKLPWEDASFDWIYTVNTVYFWDDPAAGFAEIARTLKPGGRLLNVFYSQEWLDSRQPFTRHGFVRYSIPRLAEITEQSGLKVVEVVEIRPGASYGMIAEKDRSNDAELL